MIIYRMPTDTTGSDHILLSSDSETSNDRNENLTMAPTLISSISELFNISRNTEIIEGISNISTSSQNIQTIFHIQNTEGQIIKDNGVSTTTSQTNGSTFQRRSIKIQDETGKINITIWNKKNEEIPDNVINQHIRIRNGKINVYNGKKTC
ncbi:unnamed protein product [Rotaria magnacalcarata]|uniref:Replication protein A OB domain-containing protein n=2 Tax=Rotaria magnacalcarata TaxID=392030 RepID=A0A816LSW7_9BILA|nr:unnamed protein product [Rotaria magnacalcarata]